MAKFALVGYGRNGEGVGKTVDGYTYVVNDNVRTGDIIQPVATSRANRKFVTTGKVNHSFKENTVKGQEAKRAVEEKGKDVTQVYTGKELGVNAPKGAPKAPEGEKQPLSQYNLQTRAGNLAMELKKNPQTKLTENAENTLKKYGTFDEYSKPFMKQGEQK